MGLFKAHIKQKLREAFHASGLEPGEANLDSFLPRCTEKAPELKIRGTRAERTRLQKIATFVAQSEAGKEILDDLAENGTKICFMKTDFGGREGFYLPHMNALYLDPREDDSKQIELLAHEGRHAGQQLRAPESFKTLKESSLSGLILNERFREADAYAMSGLVKAQLQHKKAEISEGFGDFRNLTALQVNRHFAEIAAMDSSALFDGRAAKSAFAHWVQLERHEKNYEKKTVDFIESRLEMPSATKEGALAKPISEQDIHKICSLNGQSYLKSGDTPLDLSHSLISGVSSEAADKVRWAIVEYRRRNSIETHFTNDVIANNPQDVALTEDDFNALLSPKKEAGGRLPPMQKDGGR